MRRRVPASAAHFSTWTSRLMICRFGRPQNDNSDGQSMSRCSRQTRNSGTRWSTSEVFHSRPPVCGAFAALQAADQLGVVARRVPQPPRRNAGGVPGGICVRARAPTGPRASRAGRPAGRTRNRTPDLARKPSRGTVRAARGSSPATRSCALPSAARSSPSGVPLRRASARASLSARSGCVRQYPSTASRGIGGVQRRLSA